MSIQKIILAAVMAGSAMTAMAEWQRISFNNKDVALYMDIATIKPKIDQYQNRYLETNISRAYTEPRKLQSGKFYTHYNETLSVDCEHGAYAASNGKWRINNKDVQQAAAKEEDWNKYDREDTGSYAVTARAICKQYKSFLGG